MLIASKCYASEIATAGKSKIKPKHIHNDDMNDDDTLTHLRSYPSIVNSVCKLNLLKFNCLLKEIKLNVRKCVIK